MTYPQQPLKASNGFAITIQPDTRLTAAMLVVEFSDGIYQPVASVETIEEARQFAAEDIRMRMRELETGASPACPESYVVWARGIRGSYRQVERIEP